MTPTKGITQSHRNIRLKTPPPTTNHQPPDPNPFNLEQPAIPTPSNPTKKPKTPTQPNPPNTHHNAEFTRGGSWRVPGRSEGGHVGVGCQVPSVDKTVEHNCADNRSWGDKIRTLQVGCARFLNPKADCWHNCFCRQGVDTLDAWPPP